VVSEGLMAWPVQDCIFACTACETLRSKSNKFLVPNELPDDLDGVYD
jgi:hypothetical protein